MSVYYMQQYHPPLERQEEAVNPERRRKKAMMRSLGMTGKQYRRYEKKLRREGTRLVVTTR